ncbi:LysR family transcriptional regulator [Staphylococcus sp. NRL 16/872]|uniref:glutamate biosynthesis transcriptional regulator GltC n=1 Tax=Staphylococcus sp. NRL 16/872 TaxID=2930131 RepID=UPI001FB56A08|nr:MULTISPECIES: LysR family transcriptional regulator [unclassified Staphylococcus]MCJ1657164.1 LysR family transcriptional regulator [Staphylococcus sp. NRL 21/187]MCJ1662904.1 LysR family transcriptional regulator [Staphylococcus sp. NRL 18/288]MCJ1669029.1 LysR family transcriptional regulator [Staphylococcus sp. NRL 19/737]WEN69248.1 LysR family transcriptional regulator [Staphylococcus sp. NRL 16/872]
MEFKQLKYFVEVAKREHISEAALELNIAQSAISRQITLLEQELQVTLFNRQGRNIRLTSQGKALLTQATQILGQLDETVALFQREKFKNAHTIHIGFEESYVSTMITPLIQSFEQNYESTILPTLMTMPDIIEKIYTGALDIGLIETTPELQQDKRVSLKPLFEETYHIYVPKDDAVALATNPPLSQFEKQMLYTLTPLAPSIELKLKSIIKSSINIVGTESLAKYLLKQGRGYILVPNYVNLHYTEQQLCDISLAHTELKRSFCVIAKKDNNKVDVLNLLNLIQQRLSKVTTYH